MAVGKWVIVNNEQQSYLGQVLEEVRRADGRVEVVLEPAYAYFCQLAPNAQGQMEVHRLCAPIDMLWTINRVMTVVHTMFVFDEKTPSQREDLVVNAERMRKDARKQESSIIDPGDVR